VSEKVVVKIVIIVVVINAFKKKSYRTFYMAEPLFDDYKLLSMFYIVTCRPNITKSAETN